MTGCVPAGLQHVHSWVGVAWPPALVTDAPPFPCVFLCCCHSVNSASGKTCTAVCTDGGISNTRKELSVWAVIQPGRQPALRSHRRAGVEWSQPCFCLPLLADEDTEAQRRDVACPGSWVLTLSWPDFAGGSPDP